MDRILSAPFTIENALQLYQIAQSDPSFTLDKKALEWFEENKDDLQGIFIDFSLSVVETGLKESGDDFALQIGMMFGTLYKNAPYGSWTSSLNQSLTAGITSTASSAFNATTNFLGSAVKSSVLGIGIGTTLGMASGNSFGQAFASSAVTTGVSLGLNSLVIAAFTAATMATPIGWAAVAVAATISVVTTFAFNKNFLGMKDFAEDFGNKIDDGMKWAGNVVSHSWDSTNWSW